MAGIDYDYGFRVSTFTVADAKGPGQSFPLDYAALGSGAAQGVYLDALRTLKDEGGRTDSRDRYLAVEKVEGLGLCILVHLRGGQSGDEFDVIDAETNTETGKFTRGDALTWISRVLFVFPTGNHHDGLIVAEAKGRSSHGGVLLERLERLLKENHSLRPSVMHDVADGVAWNQLFRLQQSHVSEVEFQFSNPAHDGTGFTEDNSVTKVKVAYQLSPGGRADKKSTAVITGERGDPRGMLLRAVGGHRYGEQEMEDPVATIVTNGRPRKYRVSNTPSRFTRIIEQPKQLETQQFLWEVSPAVVETCNALHIDLPNDWLPNLG